MECKYLSDGRKVAIIGQLNNVESIVQEIFITESGDEIPSGERFTTKSLHDEPVLSYKEKQIKKIDERAEEAERQYELADRKKNEIKEELKAYQQILKSTRILTDNFKDEKNLETFTKFLSCDIEYLVVDLYSITPPIKMIDAVVEYDRYYSGEKKFDGVKLLSVLGSSDGNMTYKLHRYYDGSGSNQEVFPFSNKEDALEHIRKRAVEKIEKGQLYEESWQACIDMGIRFDTESFETFYKYMRESAQKNLDHFLKNQVKTDNTIQSYKDTLKKYGKS